MKRAEQLQPPVARDDVRVVYAEQGDPEAEAAIDRWLRSLLDKPGTPDKDGRP